MSLPTPTNLPSPRDILQNALLQNPETMALIRTLQAVMPGSVRPEDTERIQRLLQTRVIGRGMKWLLKTVAA